MTSFTDLPLELVLNVVAHLDNNSIANFLRAFPSLKKEAILITDHHFDPIHFDIDGIHRAYLPNKCPHHMDLEMYDKSRHRHTIKLAEFFYSKESLPLCLLGDADTGLPIDAQVFSLDPHCFIHARSINGTDLIMTSFNRLDRLGVGCKTSMGFSRYISEYGCEDRREHQRIQCDASTALTTASLSAISYETIQSLTLSGVTTFVGHFFPLLTDLKITFSMSESSPDISQITAPALWSLSITYGDVFPVINIDVSELASEESTSDAKVKQYKPCSSFELLCIGTSFQSEGVESIISKCDLTYVALCGSVHFSGVHFKVIKACAFDETYQLCWDILSQSEEINHIDNLNMTRVKHLMITVEADGSCLPTITCRSIFSVALRLMVPSVKCFDFLMSLSGAEIVKIHRGSFAQKTCQSHAILTLAEWDQFMALKTEWLKHLELVGFEIPFLQAKNTLKKVSYHPCYLINVVLMPVMKKSDFSDKDVFCLDGIRLDRAMRPFVFDFSPIMLNADATFAASQRSILFDVGLKCTHLWEWFTIKCSPLFKAYHLEGLKRCDDGVGEVPTRLGSWAGLQDQAILEQEFPDISAVCGRLALSTSVSPIWVGMMEQKYGTDDTKWRFCSEDAEPTKRTIVKHSWCGRCFGVDEAIAGRCMFIDYSPLYQVSTLRGSTNYGLHGRADFPTSIDVILGPGR